MEIDEKKKTPFYKKSGFIPAVALLLLFIILVLSSHFSGRPPQIDEITPQIGLPGEVMVIKGRFFGKTRENGEVEIGGVTVVASDYIEWKDNEISVRIPDDASSGMVFVKTKNGVSRGKLFTNKKQIPIVIEGPMKPGEPYIQRITPEAGYIGTLLTITGMNFGIERGRSAVFFPWIPEKGRETIAISKKLPPLPAPEYDYSYEKWSDREIQVRVPDGVSSGRIFLETDKGKSNSIYFELKRRGGTKLFLDRRTYSIQYGLSIENITSLPDNGLYVWMPKVIETPAQRNIQQVSQEPNPIFPDVNGTALFYFKGLQTNETYKIVESFMFDRYEIVTKISPSRVSHRYDRNSRLYKVYTSPDFFVHSDSARVIRIARRVVGRERNPYRKARSIYNYVRILLKQSDKRVGDIDRVIDLRRGSSFDYSILFCSLARAVGIPARPIAGIVVTRARKSVRHFWAEFYLPNIGWVPVDPFLGDRNTLVTLPPDVSSREYYFGNLDNSHITFCKGTVTLKQMSPKGRRVQRDMRPDLLTLHEEAVGDLYSYSTYWQGVDILGIY